MPASNARRRSPYLRRRPSRSTNRDAQNASVAPIELANETRIVPSTRPKIAPPARVRITAPGSDTPVTSTYIAKNPPAASHGFAAVQACNAPCRALSPSRLSSASSPLRQSAKATRAMTSTTIQRDDRRGMRFQCGDGRCRDRVHGNLDRRIEPQKGFAERRDRATAHSAGRAGLRHRRCRRHPHSQRSSSTGTWQVRSVKPRPRRGSPGAGRSPRSRSRRSGSRRCCRACAAGACAAAGAARGPAARGPGRGG